MKRARWYLLNGYSAKRVSELMEIPLDVAEKMKNGWPQDQTWQGLENERRQAGQIIEGEIRKPEDS